MQITTSALKDLQRASEQYSQHRATFKKFQEITANIPSVQEWKLGGLSVGEFDPDQEAFELRLCGARVLLVLSFRPKSPTGQAGIVTVYRFNVLTGRADEKVDEFTFTGNLGETKFKFPDGDTAYIANGSGPLLILVGLFESILS